MLEEPLQRTVGLGGVAFLAGDGRKGIEHLVEALIVHGIGAGEHTVPAADARDGPGLWEFQRLAVQRRGDQRGGDLPVAVSPGFQQRIGVRPDGRQVVRRPGRPRRSARNRYQQQRCHSKSPCQSDHLLALPSLSATEAGYI